MKLWSFCDPGNYKYARASRRGSWEGSPSRRVKPLIIEWEPGSDLVGDFTWPGVNSEVIVKESVANVLHAADVPGFELGPVHMQENSEPAKRRSKKPQITLPYSGPQLWELWVPVRVNIDRERTTIEEIKRKDGTVDHKLIGYQHEETSWDQLRMELIKQMHQRVEGQGLFVPTTTGIFRVEEYPGFILCTDAVKRLIEEHDFTNVSFLEMGDVIDKPLDGLPPFAS